MVGRSSCNVVMCAYICCPSRPCSLWATILVVWLLSLTTMLSLAAHGEHDPVMDDLEAQATINHAFYPPSRSSVTAKDVIKVNNPAASVVSNPLEHLSSLEELNDTTIIALPPPCSFDVVVRDLSIATPPYRAEIPTPIPIPIPHIITDTLRKWQHGHINGTGTTDAGDGLILRNVNATIRRGELMAVIGGSGSGKTTLLHAIARRLGNLPIAHGHVAIVPSDLQDDAATGRAGATEAVGFVRQNDYLLPHLTGTFPSRTRLREGCGASAADAKLLSAA